MSEDEEMYVMSTGRLSNHLLSQGQDWKKFWAWGWRKRQCKRPASPEKQKSTWTYTGYCPLEKLLGQQHLLFNSVKHLDILNFSLKNFTVLAAHNSVISSPQWHWYMQKKLLHLALYIRPSQTCSLCSVACQDWAVRSALLLITQASVRKELEDNCKR